MFRRFTAVASAIVLVLAMTGTATAAHMGAQTFDLLGPYGTAWCDGSGVISGTAGGYGTATISDNQNGTISVEASVNKIVPDTWYSIRLIQGDADCHAFHMKFKSDEYGHGSAHWLEATTSSSAFVSIQDHYGHTVFVTQTLKHGAEVGG